MIMGSIRPEQALTDVPLPALADHGNLKVEQPTVGRHRVVRANADSVLVLRALPCQGQGDVWIIKVQTIKFGIS